MPQIFTTIEKVRKAFKTKPFDVWAKQAIRRNIPRYFDNMLDLDQAIEAVGRSTGKTTRMFYYALVKVSQGQPVLIVGSTNEWAKELADWLKRLAIDLDLNYRLISHSGYKSKRLAGSKAAKFYDHSVYEQMAVTQFHKDNPKARYYLDYRGQ